MKQCNLPTTRECFARPCMNCVPTDKSREEEEADWLDEVSEPDPEREWQEVLEIAAWFGCEFLFETVQLPQSPNARDPFPQDEISARWEETCDSYKQFTENTQHGNGSMPNYARGG